jgi:hypothetical protein
MRRMGYPQSRHCVDRRPKRTTSLEDETGEFGLRLDRIAASSRLARQRQTPASAVHESIRAGTVQPLKGRFSAAKLMSLGHQLARIWRDQLQQSRIGGPKVTPHEAIR